MTTHPQVERFQATVPFPLDPFQILAMEALETERGTLVSAPTSSGKTLIAEYAVWKALTEQVSGTAVIYTTPLKALSNQKYRELCDRYGDVNVGLVTGEHAVNEYAPVLVMTTEILRNIVYDEPERLSGVRDVILDEIHFINEYPRGTVWEEIIIGLPPGARIVGLSATVSNIDEMAAWMSSLRGNIEVIRHDVRPVDLVLWMAVGNHLYSMFDDLGAPHPTLLRRLNRSPEERDPGHHPRRWQEENDLLTLVPTLHREGLTPAMYFIFSRRGCREALATCEASALRLTTEEESRLIAEHYRNHVGRLSTEEQVLFEDTISQDVVMRGLAMHHAGMLPSAKELIELLFQQGLIKVVFATETLSLGLNMPARSCIISSFTKYDGIGFHSLTSTDVTQLLGRAGRRGIDIIGHGVILHDRDVLPEVIFEAASGSDMEILSKFTPTYAMVLNLLKRHDYARAVSIMEQSFGHYQALQRMDSWSTTAEGLAEELAAIQLVRFAHPHRSCSQKTIRSYLRHEEQLHDLLSDKRVFTKDHWRPQGKRNRSGFVATKISEYRRLIAQSRKEIAKSPCHHCPYFEDHRDHIHQVDTIQYRLANEEEQLRAAQHRFRTEFDALRAVLHALGFLEDDSLTALGTRAASLFGDRSLLIAMAIEHHLFDELTPEECATAISLLVSEDRSPDRGYRSPRMPSSALHRVSTQMTRMLRAIEGAESLYDIPRGRPIALDYVHAVYAWATDVPLDAIHLPEGADIGDLIRLVKNSYAMLRQIEHATRSTPFGAKASAARASLERDVIVRL